MHLLRFALWGALFALPVVVVLPTAAQAAAQFQILCNTGGDQLGYSIATNGDYNGDGVPDIAIGSPCHHVGANPRAGRVLVLSGVNGKRLLSRRGTQIGQWMGAGVTFLGDINRDGRDELAVGSPGYTSTPSDDDTITGTGRTNAGRVDVFQKKRRRLKMFGQVTHSGFGEKIAALGDINGDRRPDLAVSASRAKKPDGRDRPGRVYIFSGRDGEQLDVRVGPVNGKRYGREMVAAGDVNGDGMPDLLIGSQEMNLFQVTNSGVVDTVDPLDFQEEITRVLGTAGDGMGSGIDDAGDINDDDIPDFIAGSLKSDDVNGVKDAGLVSLFSSSGTRLWVVPDTDIQEDAAFGDAVAKVGDMNGDGHTDFIAAASEHDVAVNGRLHNAAGRIVALSGVNGSALWAKEGVYIDQRFGYAVDGELDWNEDDVPDVVVGAIGDAPLGRRGAGSVKILSGRDGSQLFQIPGRRGLETRVVVAAPVSTAGARAKSLNYKGRRSELDAVTLGGRDFGDLSVDILNDRNQPFPRTVQAVVATGSGATNSEVEVFTLGRKSRLIDTFDAFPNLIDTGASCAAGELDNGEDGEVIETLGTEDLACVQADSLDGNVILRVLRRLDEESPFFPIREFQIFSSEDIFNEFFPINAGGATVAVGDVSTESAGDEIVVGTTSGVPWIKVFDETGVLLNEFLAYDPVGFSGVDVSISDVSLGGRKEIITAPRAGQALIKVFRGSGERVTVGNTARPISILAMPASFTHGARVAGADVDLDDFQEILVYLPKPLGQRKVMAFETDGTVVESFRVSNPFSSSVLTGGAIAATDLFVRH